MLTLMISKPYLQAGGAVFQSGCASSISFSIFTGNTAGAGTGGAVYRNACHGYTVNCSFLNNSAAMVCGLHTLSLCWTAPCSAAITFALFQCWCAGCTACSYCMPTNWWSCDAIDQLVRAARAAHCIRTIASRTTSGTAS